jgi:hypothetical protein
MQRLRLFFNQEAKMQNIKKIAIIFLTPLFLGCQGASNLLHEAVAPQLHNYIKSSEVLKECKLNKALSIVGTNQNELLKSSELGLINFFKKSYKDSNRYFDKAISLYRINENKSTIALSNIVRNEYQGEGFDKVFLHNYKAISYLMLGDAEAARIESKNSNMVQEEERLKLKQFTEAYDTDNKNTHLLTRYEKIFNRVHAEHHPYQNPFAYYISALGYAEDGDYNNALVDIRNAIKFNHESSLLKSKLITYQKKDAKSFVELFFDVGNAPLKSQVKLKMDMGNGEERMAYMPSYTLTISDVDFIKIIDSRGDEVARTSLLSDVNAIKVNEFKEKLPAVLSMIVKEATVSMGSEVLDERSKLLATIFKTGSAVYGQNDVSTWSSLPEKILVASFLFEPKKQYSMVVVDKRGQELIRKRLELKKDKGLKNIYKHYMIRDNKICN